MTSSLFIPVVFETVLTSVFLRCANAALTRLKNAFSFYNFIGGSGRTLSLITDESTFGGGIKL